VLEDSWDAEIVDDLDVQEADHVVQKHTYDAFHQTELDGWLSARGIDDLLFCGTLANVCVLHTAGSAGLRDYRPVLVEDAIGALEDDHKEYALEHADWLFGEVTTSDALEF
jgi:nicotinamidase-related amidase